ncbi:winged helix DNA-binding domain-containing protein [Streptomyces sp. NPDC006638]|uniref:winged helix DNA-binding domain-containing protein n=1 Tax=Streptomyces sp. NPDC006638 TaxID=3157183 RepID=UPI0033B274BC
MTPKTLTDRELNRALLARQGLLERLDLPLPEAVEAIGAVQAQYGPALPVALWTRVRGVDAGSVRTALERRTLVVGTLLRRTLHLVTPAQHAAYAAVVVAAGDDTWRRTRGESDPAADRLRERLTEFAGSVARSPEEVADWIEKWVAAHPEAIDAAELEFQRTYKWRPFRSTVAVTRSPVGGVWDEGVPDGVLAAPAPEGGPPSAEDALHEVVLRHLRAFGPAGAADVAQWIGAKVTPVKALLKSLEDRLAVFGDEGGQLLYDLPEAPRPPADAPAPVRLLPWFDSTLLAYAPKRRTRILPQEYRDAVYAKANLQLRPTFLVDGTVAGVWALDRKRREAVLTLTPLTELSRTVTAELVAEAEHLLPVCVPDGPARVVVADRS